MKVAKVEWPTLGLLVGTYGLFALGTTWAAEAWLPFGMACVMLSAVMHSSLCHEALHGHPTRVKWLNEALVFVQLTLCVPYGRFRDLHLIHHQDENLTDPYDDPESNYRDPAIWAVTPRWGKVLLSFNNTLLGRILVGPAVGQFFFMRDDWRAILAGDRAALSAWLVHIPAVAIVIWWVVAHGSLPLWALFVAVYAALGVLKIRTFLEHRAHEATQGRTVIVEDRGPLALLFLNNNYHVVHHERPGVPWYRLPALFRAEREAFLGKNDGYYYRSYAHVFAKYFLRAKDPVPHPLWPKP
ncbi:fatty acid desaturase [Lentibacter sp. XHP0401]|uniref:fatty acid desaturase n=1 Tax=Lentibacter sp. XHP0401 TaxID=2984334 RepID=UPI0021E7851E|nr:fatty acid desaturase [Lentibacter sp. XHP0401]MCV2893012.1 fatty acid desaturase [Lentibacter sp. XHP0401]